METQDRNSRNVAVSLAAWRALKQRALDAGVTVREVVERLVAAPVTVPPSGWKAPATTTSPAHRPTPKQKAASAVTGPDLQAKLDAITGRTGRDFPMSARSAMKQKAEAEGKPDLKVEDDTDVPY